MLNTGRLSLEQAATTVLDLSAHEDFQVGSETERLVEELVLASKVRLAMVQAVEVHALEVEAEAGVVTLEGYLARQEDLEALLRAAQEVEGVQRWSPTWRCRPPSAACSTSRPPAGGLSGRAGAKNQS